MASVDALLLCDSATREAQSGEWTLSGVFDALWVQRFPTVHQSMDVYFRIRSDGPIRADLACQEPSGSMRPLATLDIEPSARALVEGAVRLTGVELAMPGEHRFVLQVAGEPLGATSLIVAQLPEPSRP